MMVMESFTLTSSLPFNVEETELYELTELAGVTIDPKVFKLVQICIAGKNKPTYLLAPVFTYE